MPDKIVSLRLDATEQKVFGKMKQRAIDARNFAIKNGQWHPPKITDSMVYKLALARWCGEMMEEDSMKQGLNPKLYTALLQFPKRVTKALAMLFASIASDRKKHEQIADNIAGFFLLDDKGRLLAGVGTEEDYQPNDLLAKFYKRTLQAVGDGGNIMLDDELPPLAKRANAQQVH